MIKYSKAMFYCMLGLLLIVRCGKTNEQSQVYAVENYLKLAEENKKTTLLKYDTLYQSNVLQHSELLRYIAIKTMEDDSSQNSIALIQYNLSNIKAIEADDKANALAFLIIYRKLTQYFNEENDCNNAVKYGYHALEAADKYQSEKKINKSIDYFNLAKAYRLCGNIEKYKTMIDSCVQNKPNSLLLALCYHNYCDYYVLKDMYDSATIYIQKSIADLTKLNEPKHLYEAKLNYATILNKQQKIDEALTIALQAVSFQEENNNSIALDYILIARLYFKKGDFQQAQKYFEKAKTLAQSDNEKISLYTNYSYLYEAKKDYINTIRCMDSIIDISERVNQREYALKTKELEENYKLRQKDDNIKQLQLANQNAENSLKIRTLIIFILLLFVVVVVVFTIQYINNKKLQVKHEKIVLEQRLFNSQMSPHFIFNALSAIQAEILSANNKTANLYLTKFGQLLQNILYSTTQEKVSIATEYKNIINYIELQAIRFKNFSFESITYEGIEQDEDLICPMLIQPLVENAIHHGLIGLSYPGILIIKISKYDKYIECSIADNGAGIQEKQKVEKLSVSTKLIQDRLAILSATYKIKCTLDIQNKKQDTGVVSRIQIPYESN